MKTLARRSLSLLLALLIMLSVPVQALAADWYLDEGDITVDTGSQTVTQGATNQSDSAPVISQSRPTDGSGNPAVSAPEAPPAEGTVNNTVTITGGGEANVTIKGDAEDPDDPTKNDITVKVDGVISAGDDAAIKVESGDVDINFENYQDTIYVSKDNSAGVEVGDANVTIDGLGDNSVDIMVTGGNSTGIQVNGDNANVTLEGDAILATGQNSTGVNIEGDNAQVTLNSSIVQAADGHAIAIKGDAAKNSKVRLTLNNSIVRAWYNGGSGIDINSDGVHHFESASYMVEGGKLVTVKNPTAYQMETVVGTAAGAFLDKQDHKKVYYTISADQFPDYQVAEEVRQEQTEPDKAENFTVMQKTEDLDGNGTMETFIYVTYTVANPAFNLADYNRAQIAGEPYTVPEVIEKTVYLDVIEKMVDVEIELKGENTVIVTDDEDDDFDDNIGERPYFGYNTNDWTGPDDTAAGDGSDDGDVEYGISHAAIHVSEDNLTITSSENGSLTAEVTDPHDSHWDHDTDSIYFGADTNTGIAVAAPAVALGEINWLAFEDVDITNGTDGLVGYEGPCNDVVNVSYVVNYGYWDDDGIWHLTSKVAYVRMYCPGHDYETDLASAAAIGTNSITTYADRVQNVNENGTGKDGAGFEGISDVHGEFENLTGSITITGSANVTAKAAQYYAQNASGEMVYPDYSYAGAGVGTGYGGTVEGAINVTGDASLNASSTWGAGIGAGQGGGIDTTGSITVDTTGTVTGSSVHGVSAGIGAGQSGNMAGTITVSGSGTVTGTATTGAGIGAGENGGITETGSINISGTGTVTGSAVSGAGIGGGINGAQAGSATIAGGNVTGTSSTGAGIGGGANGALSGSTAITGGSVTGVSTAGGAGIGGGMGGAVTGTGSITIEGDANVKANATSGAGIGSGTGVGVAGAITIGGDAKVSSASTSGAAIGTGSGVDGDLTGVITVKDNAQILGTDTTAVTSTGAVHYYVYDVMVDGIKTGLETFSEPQTDDPENGISYIFKRHYTVETITEVTENTVGASSRDGAAIGTGHGGDLTEGGRIDILGGQVAVHANVGAAIGTGTDGQMNGGSSINVSDAEITINRVTTVTTITKELTEEGEFKYADKQQTIETEKLIGASSYNGAAVGTGANGSMNTASVSVNEALIVGKSQTGAVIGTGQQGDISEDSFIDVDDTRIQTYTEVVSNTYKKSYTDVPVDEFILLKSTSTEKAAYEETPIPQSIAGAVVGTGWHGDLAGDITLTDSIAQIESNMGAGIGTGMNGSMTKTSDITINSSTVLAHSETGAAIGLGQSTETQVMDGDITIKGSSVVQATSGSNAAIGSYYGSTTHMYPELAEDGAYVLISDLPEELQKKASVDMAIQNADGSVTRFHKLNAAELAQLAKELNNEKFPDYKPVNPLEGIDRYEISVPTISILDNAYVLTTDKTENVTVDDLGVIGVAGTKADHASGTHPVESPDYNHVYRISGKATINGIKNASLNFLSEFMNLFHDVENGKRLWTNIFWERNEKSEIGEIIYWVTEYNDLSVRIGYEDEIKDGVLTVVAEKDDACFVTTQRGLEKLKSMGIKTIIFKSGETVSEFDVTDALAAYTTGHLVICHDHGTVTFIIGGEEVKDVLKEKAE